MRFFGQPDEAIERCMAKLTLALPQTFAWRFHEPTPQMVEHAISSGYPQPLRVVRLTFSTMEAASAAAADARTKLIYQAHCAPAEWLERARAQAARAADAAAPVSDGAESSTSGSMPQPTSYGDLPRHR